MHYRWIAALLVAVSSLFGTAALAQADPGIEAEVKPLPAQVTLNRPAVAGTSLALDSYASFFVPLRNNGGSTLNRVFFNAMVSSDQQSVVVDSVIGLPATAACTGVGTASIQCTIGSVAKGAGLDFYVVVKAPSAGSRIDLNYVTGGDEGNGGGNGCCNLAGSATTLLRDPATDTQALVRTTSFVRSTGGVFFTGSGIAVTTADPWLTLVSVPGTSFVTTLEIFETPAAVPLASNLFTRETSELTIPGSFASLQIILRRDVSTIAPSAKIANARIYYARPVDGVYPPGPGTELFACTASGPTAGVPCIERRTEYTKKTAPTPAWEGDWEFVIRALDNGRYSQ
jgi:hypothetical protein